MDTKKMAQIFAIIAYNGRVCACAALRLAFEFSLWAAWTQTHCSAHFFIIKINFMGKILRGDCMDILPTIPAKTIDLIFTDPPYSSPTVHAFGRQVVKRLSDLAIQEYYFAQLKKEFERVLKPNAPVLIFCDDVYFAVLTALFYDWQQTNLIVWNKKKIGMGNPFRRQHELIFYANRGSLELNQESASHIPTIIDCPIQKQYHGAEKPVPLLKKLISGLTKKGDTILDPFCGSSSTGVACVQTERNFIGIELEQEYFDVSSKRIQNSVSAPSLFSF